MCEMLCILVCLVAVNFSLAFRVRHTLNERTCKGKEDRMYVVFQLQCSFAGAGMYRFEGPPSVRKILMDRITVDSMLIIESESVETVTIDNAEFENPCDHVIAPAAVQVTVGGTRCVSDHMMIVCVKI